MSALAASLIFIIPFYVDSAMNMIPNPIPQNDNSLPLLLSWYSAVLGLTLVHQGDSFPRLPIQFLALAIKPSSLSLVVSQFIILVLTLNIRVELTSAILVTSAALGIWSKAYIEDDFTRLLICVSNGAMMVGVMGYKGLMESLHDGLRMWRARKSLQRTDKLSTKED